jgi:hypothetical protein
MSATSFKDALHKLATDAQFRNDAINDPTKVVEQYRLTREELRALASAGRMSGADMTQVDAIFGFVVPAQITSPQDTSISCCCCCCCGTEGILVHH